MLNTKSCDLYEDAEISLFYLFPPTKLRNLRKLLFCICHKPSPNISSKFTP